MSVFSESLVARCSVTHCCSALAALSFNVHGIEDLVTRYGWWGILFLMALQGATMPVANEITMPLAGWLLVQAVGKSKALILFAGLVGATGWVIGALVAYAVMAVGGRALLARLRRRFPQVERALARSDAWFERWGAWAAFFARLLPDLADDHHPAGGCVPRARRPVRAGDLRGRVHLVYIPRRARLCGGQPVGSRA